jgi:hypothetical protein
MTRRGPARLAARVALEAAGPARAEGSAGVRLVGRDVARTPRRARSAPRPALPALVAAAVAIGLALVALRNDLIRMRYGLSAAMQQERELLGERRELTARVRALRDPARLARLARDRGFVRPERVFESGTAGGAAP